MKALVLITPLLFPLSARENAAKSTSAPAPLFSVLAIYFWSSASFAASAARCRGLASPNRSGSAIFPRVRSSTSLLISTVRLPSLFPISYLFISTSSSPFVAFERGTAASKVLRASFGVSYPLDPRWALSKTFSRSIRSRSAPVLRSLRVLSCISQRVIGTSR